MTSPPPPVLQRSDGTTREEWDTGTSTYRMWDSDVLVIERPFTAEETAAISATITAAVRDANRATLTTALTAALAVNATYLAKVTAGTATATDHLGQVPGLTRQIQALIRITLGAGLLDSTDGGTSPTHQT